MSDNDKQPSAIPADEVGPRYMDAAARLSLLAPSPSAGVAYWQPAGFRLYAKLRQFIQAAHHAAGYQEVRTPALTGVGLYAQSGHLDRYRENMFFANQSAEGELDEQGYALRPMSCPNHIVLYRAELHSYRDLPLRLFEFGDVFRNEPSGSLQTLFRLRQFCQDDSHVFVSEEALVDSLSEYLQLARKVYGQLGFTEVKYAISLRPARRFGRDDQWDRAEEALRQACRENGIEWTELPGEGAFYGPKIELQVSDKLGRAWQLGTMQLDYVLPDRFDLGYINTEGNIARPVMLHHAVLGSMERMIGTLLENHGTELPDWLHPYPAVIVPVSAKAQAYAQQVADDLKAAYPELHVDCRQEPLGAKLRHWRTVSCPNVFVVGEAEVAHFAATGELVVNRNRNLVSTAVLKAEKTCCG